MTLTRDQLQRFQAGEASAFAEVVRAYSGLLRKIVAGHWHSAFEQEEAMQEIWAHLYRQRATLDLSRSDEFSGWVSTLAKRRALDLWKRAKEPAGAAEGESVEVPEPPRPDPVEVAELSAAVEAFRAKLAPGWQQFFTLYFVQELDYAEVAATLHISRLRCKYMKKVLLRRAQKHAALSAALGRARAGGGRAPS